MDEFLQMLERGLLPWNWTTAKFGSALLLLLLYYGWKLAKRRHHRALNLFWHALLMLLVWGFLLFISIHGVVTRGVFGTLYTEPHTAFYKHVAFVHLGCGAVYFALGAYQILLFLMWKLLKSRVFYRQHKPVGETALFCATISIVCLFFLK